MLINFNIGILSQDICKSSWCILLNKWRIARRDKKDFLNEQRKEIEQNNRMGKARGLFKKIRDISEKILARIGTIKDINGKDLTK